MSCCGSQRAALRQAAVNGGGGAPAAYQTGALEFEYYGSGTLRIVGPLTGAIVRQRWEFLPASFSRNCPRLSDNLSSRTIWSTCCGRPK